ncbi:MAG: riboflavin synthase [Cloacibacterium sp.]|jgi:riboflavin synthase|nr:riboflavin synthase [Cloacibacterium sp.]
MFTGIIEAIGVVENIRYTDSNIHFTISCPFTQELKIDQSVAHNGCCLTVVETNAQNYTVTAIGETLEKTNLGKWQIGSLINLERCVKIDGRLDGHIVQGHIDQIGNVISIENKDGSYLITIRYEAKNNFATVAQGSISVNGISLTVANSEVGEFSVAIIPYTWENTNLKELKIGDSVNLEFDIIGKYVAQLTNQYHGSK